MEPNTLAAAPRPHRAVPETLANALRGSITTWYRSVWTPRTVSVPAGRTLLETPRRKLSSSEGSIAVIDPPDRPGITPVWREIAAMSIFVQDFPEGSPRPRPLGSCM